MKIQCTFVPQYWSGLKQDYAYPAEPEGDTTWIMDMREVEYLTGVTDMENMDDDPYARDNLRNSKHAPEWVLTWSGPFEVEWLVLTDNSTS